MLFNSIILYLIAMWPGIVYYYFVMMCSNLSGSDISYFRDNRKVVSEVSFCLEAGQSLLITGRNGAGKTTLLRIIAGILEPDAGVIKIDGSNIHDDYFAYKKSIAYLGHKDGFNEDWTVEENLVFWARMRDTVEVIFAAVCYFGLDKFMYMKYSNLSAGWKKRVGFARMLISDAQIWLLDEPFASLDSVIEQSLLGLLNTRLQQDGIVIMSNHKQIELGNMKYLHL